MTDTVLLWLRQDLRLADQPALVAAAAQGAVIPVYVLDDEGAGGFRPGGASRWWLHHSLAALDRELRARGSRLILRRGPAAATLAALAKDSAASAVHAIRHHEPWWRDAEAALAERTTLHLHDGNHLAPPGTVTTGSGQPFRIYSPFWRALARTMPPAAPLPPPSRIAAPRRWPVSDRLEDWALLPVAPDWATGFADWTPGEQGAHDRLERFADEIEGYCVNRDRPGTPGTSSLSPHLHHGEISPRTVWHRVAGDHAPGQGGDVDRFLMELAWRDFTTGIIRQAPDHATVNARPAFDRLRWRTDQRADADLRAWQRGRTGYPIVDAGMRQLWATGWMHNRVRMITASFLIKHLLIDWRAGERWFWDCLIDADYGNNSVNWQWVAGTGFDSNMFTRIMAPLTQSEKFDAGAYIRRWVPELARLPDSAIHDPEEAGRRPGAYPAKIVGHREARDRALQAYAAMKQDEGEGPADTDA
jgi:deoxyribodipyrimidine photo-lyase